MAKSHEQNTKESASGETTPHGTPLPAQAPINSSEALLPSLPIIFKSLSWFLFSPVDAKRLLLFERVFSLTFLIYTAGWSLHAREWLTNYGFHVSPEAMSKSYPTPIPPISEGFLPFFLLGMFTATICRIFNKGGKLAQAFTLLFAVLIQLIDLTSAFTLNKLYIVVFAILFFAPPASKDGTHSVWPVRVIQATLLIQYGTAGTCKIFFGDWMYRSDVLFTHSVGVYRTSLAALFAAYVPMIGWTITAIYALLFELLAPILFILKSTKNLTILAGIALHVGIALMMKDLIYFSLQMMSFYLLFLSLDELQHIKTTIAKRFSKWRQNP